MAVCSHFQSCVRDQPEQNVEQQALQDEPLVVKNGSFSFPDGAKYGELYHIFKKHKKIRLMKIKTQRENIQ